MFINYVNWSYEPFCSELIRLHKSMNIVLNRCYIAQKLLILLQLVLHKNELYIYLVFNKSSFLSKMKSGSKGDHI